MRVSQLIATVLLIIGGIIIAATFFTHLLQIPVVYLDVTELQGQDELRSDSFVLRPNYPYSIGVRGENADGSGSGVLKIYTTAEDTLVESIELGFRFNFDENNEESEVTIFSKARFEAVSSSEYYMIYSSTKNNVRYGTVQFSIAYSILEHSIGIPDLDLMVFGILLMIFGGAAAGLNYSASSQSGNGEQSIEYTEVWHADNETSRSGYSKHTLPERTDQKIEHSVEKRDNDHTSPRFKIAKRNIKSKKIRKKGIICPFCGSKNQKGVYCSTCGSGLHEL